jgi:nickel and cobalt resistance protein CnrR
MKNSHKLVAFVLMLIIICSVACVLNVRLMMNNKDYSMACVNCGTYADGHEIDRHAMLHEELRLSEEEDKAIEKIEENYAREKARLNTVFQEKQNKLVSILKDGNEFSEAVNVAVNEIQHVHGDLQRLSIQHYYEMLQILPEDKKVILRELALKSLSKPE